MRKNVICITVDALSTVINQNIALIVRSSMIVTANKGLSIHI